MDWRSVRPIAHVRALPALTVATAAMYACGAALLVAGTATWEPGRNPQWVTAVLALVSCGFLAWTLLRGHRFTTAEALAMSTVKLVTVCCLTWTTHFELGALSNGTVLPIVGVYTAWFLPGRAGRSALYLGLAGWLAAIVHHDDRTLFVFAVSLILQTVLATELLGAVKRRMDRRLVTDALTGTLNRHGLFHRVRQEMLAAERRGVSLSVVAIDVDGLREVNNTRGHRAGDQLLETVTAGWQTSIRQQDAIGRTGGDEFVLVLPATTAAEAEAIMSRLAESSSAPWSGGVAQAEPGDSVAALLDRADQRMYAVKAARQGRAAPADVAAI